MKPRNILILVIFIGAGVCLIAFTFIGMGFFCRQSMSKISYLWSHELILVHLQSEYYFLYSIKIFTGALYVFCLILKHQNDVIQIFSYIHNVLYNTLHYLLEYQWFPRNPKWYSTVVKQSMISVVQSTVLNQYQVEFAWLKSNLVNFYLPDWDMNNSSIKGIE